MTLRETIAPVIRAISDASIPYAVIGGYAVAAWGRVRATRDIDLLCLSGDVARLREALLGAGLEFDHRQGDTDDPIRHVIRVRLPTNEGIDELDILADIQGAPVGILSRAQLLSIDGMDVRVAGPEDMILLKLLAGSPLDLADAQSILNTRGSAIDHESLEKHCPPRLREALTGLKAKQNPT